MTTEPIIIKIGGSVLGDKRQDMVFREEKIASIVKDIANLYKNKKTRFVIVHGVSSAGHIPVKKYELYKGFLGEHQLIGFTIAQNRVNKLRQLLLDYMEKEGLPGIEFYPSSLVSGDKGRVIDYYDKSIKALFEVGITPVISGDMMADKTMGLSVCSGDQLVFLMAKIFDARKIIFGVDVDGVFNKDPSLDDAMLITDISFEKIKTVLESAQGAHGVDVSGGMRGKLKEIAMHKEFFDRGGEVWIINMLTENALSKALSEDADFKFTRIHT